MSATYSHAFDHIPGEDDSEYAYTDFEVQIQRPLAFLRVKDGLKMLKIVIVNANCNTLTQPICLC